MTATTYTIAISGLLQRRAELVGEYEAARERLAELANDVDCVDRALRILGHEGPTDVIPPEARSVALFQRNELRRTVFSILNQAAEPLSTRQIAAQIVRLHNKDEFDRRLMTDFVRRAGKALRVLRSRREVRSTQDQHGQHLWLPRRIAHRD